LASQGGVCATCRRPETARDNRYGKRRRLSVDHNHQTGKVRGLLCTRCNHAIGLALERRDILLAMVAYLDRSTGATGAA
jgi:hypothetical protein